MGDRQLTLTTERLRLRPWRPDDLEPFAALNADPLVMAHFQSPLDREQSAAMIARIEAHFREHGFGFWALEVPGVAPLAGMVGLARVEFAAHFSPTVEIGWRLARAYWGRGYATEGAVAALDHAFGALALEEVVAFTVPANRRSRDVMARLGMRRRAEDDFDHPVLPLGHQLRRHVLYRIGRADWPKAQPA